MPKAKKPPPRFPALLIGRVCVLIPVAGVPRAALGEFILGAWVDVPTLAAECSELAWTQNLPPSALSGPGAEAFSLAMERDLGLAFSDSANEAWRTVYPEALPVHRERLDSACRSRVLEACSEHSAFSLFCSAPDASVWGGTSPDELHGDFPDEDAALTALGYVMGSVRARLEHDSGLLGWRFPLRAPLFYHRELGQNPPREVSMPLTRLGAMDPSHWPQALTDLGALSASAASALQSAEVDAASAQPKTSVRSKRRDSL